MKKGNGERKGRYATSLKIAKNGPKRNPLLRFGFFELL